MGFTSGLYVWIRIWSGPDRIRIRNTIAISTLRPSRFERSGTGLLKTHKYFKMQMNMRTTVNMQTQTQINTILK